MILHFATLNDIFHFVAQFCSSCRSFCSFSCAPSNSGLLLFILGTLQYILLSSANKHTGQSTHFGRSFMNIRNRIGPRTDPCGTPLRTSNSSDSTPRIITFCLRFSRKACIHCPI
ncbi:unnamed protein product [Meganyctiphanes norvegica]|uniref:Uncharacterized protein n=1 Tax=Meganyctiphanes norvegica TaxID=48144 RepID=A0AAV2SX59_MEGNR